MTTSAPSVAVFRSRLKTHLLTHLHSDSSCFGQAMGKKRECGSAGCGSDNG